jgi:diguanylate cyclase (GGDEF)-like protein
MLKHAAAGEIDVIVAAQLSLDEITAIMRERTGLGETGETYLVGPDQLWRSESRFLERLDVDSAILNPKTAVNTIASRDALAGNSGTQVINNYRGTMVLSSWSPVMIHPPDQVYPEGIRWALIAEIDEGEVDLPVMRMAITASILFVAVAALVTVVTLRVSRALSAPITRVADAATAVAQGDLTRRVAINTGDEIQQMANAFNYMAGEIAEMVGTLKEQVAQREQAQAQVNARNRELETLNQIAAELNNLADLPQMLDGTLKRVMELLDFTAGWVALIDETGRFQLSAARGLPPTWLEDFMRRTALCDCQRRLVTGELRHAINLVHCDRIKNIQDTGNGITKHISVPLHVGARHVGVLNFSHVESTPINDEQLRLLTAIGNEVSVAIERTRLFDTVQQLAITDSLTGLCNRRHFFALLGQEVNRSSRYGAPLSLIMLDVDHFKQVNDTYGHVVGDQVLQAITQTCRAQVRQTDTLGRYGGEEFVILLPETPLNHARQIAERICNDIARLPVTISDRLINITVSIGVASLERGYASPEKLLNDADRALYLSKQAGRNRVSISEFDAGGSP